MNFPRCPKNKYCAFIAHYEDERATCETCQFCGTKRVYKKTLAGRMDNPRYLRDHIRDFCQPTGPTHKVFAELYDGTGILPLEEIAKKHNLPKGSKVYQKDERLKNATDFYRTLLKTSL